MTFSVLTYGAPQDWQTGVMYPPGVAVVFGGTLWRCLQAHEGVSPVEGAFWHAVLSGGGGLPTGLTYASPCLDVGTDVANQAVLCGSTSGNAVSLSTSGSDAAVNLSVVTKGVGFTELRTAFVQIHPDNALSSGLILAGAQSPNAVSISASGAATDIDITVVPKGAGKFLLGPTFADTGSSLIEKNPARITSDSAAGVLIYNANESAGQIVFLTNSNTLASPSRVFSGDTLGDIYMTGMADDGGGGVAPKTGALIEARADTGVAVNIVPGLISMQTTDSAGVTKERLLINSAGIVSFIGDAAAATATSPALKGGGAGATLAVRTANDSADAPLSASVVTAGSYKTGIATGVSSGSFTTSDAKTVTVTNGLITAITP